MRQGEAQGPLELVVADDICFSLYLKTFVEDGRSVAPHLVGKVDVARHRDLHEQGMRVFAVIVELKAQPVVEELQVQAYIGLVCLLPGKVVVGKSLGNESQRTQVGVRLLHDALSQVCFLEFLSGPSPRCPELTKAQPPQRLHKRFLAEDPASAHGRKGTPPGVTTEDRRTVAAKRELDEVTALVVVGKTSEETQHRLYFLVGAESLESLIGTVFVLTYGRPAVSHIDDVVRRTALGCAGDQLQQIVVPRRTGKQLEVMILLQREVISQCVFCLKIGHHDIASPCFREFVLREIGWKEGVGTRHIMIESKGGAKAQAFQ